MEKMRELDILVNLNGWESSFDYKAYPMSKPEADVCRPALRKQIPADPFYGTDIDGRKYTACSRCMTILNDMMKYCPECGQKVRKDEQRKTVRSKQEIEGGFDSTEGMEDKETGGKAEKV